METKSENSALTFNSKIIQCLALISEMLDECHNDFVAATKTTPTNQVMLKRITDIQERTSELKEARKHLQQSYK